MFDYEASVVISLDYSFSFNAPVLVSVNEELVVNPFRTSANLSKSA
jgi:hypothetical protein